MMSAQEPTRLPTTTPWAVCLTGPAAAIAGRLRQLGGVEVCRLGENLWLRGNALDESLDRRLRCLPGAQRFLVLPDGQLRAQGARVPRGRLPEGPWIPLRRWLAVELPLAGLAGRLQERVPLKVVRSTEPQDPGAILTEVDAWQTYVATAPQARLDRWMFAAAGDGRVLVRGSPLPPIRGERLVDRDGILVPAGWTWSPAVEAAVIRNLLGLGEGDLALLHPKDAWECVPAAELVRATRPAVRTTADAFRSRAK